MSGSVVLGASPNQSKYSYKCVRSLMRHGFVAVPVGKRPGQIEDVEILTGQPDIAEVDTVVLYLNKEGQKEYYEYIFSLNPSRIIFNPGTHNQELVDLAREKGIKVVVDCALIMLSTGSY
ncbi:MAG: CoA-binding protein [Bacteroides sp. SM23_62_1]|nr:MAG: CoA-binding protein [Bacteroides sp. SM23_62_1]